MSGKDVKGKRGGELTSMLKKHWEKGAEGAVGVGPENGVRGV